MITRAADSSRKPHRLEVDPGNHDLLYDVQRATRKCISRQQHRKYC